MKMKNNLRACILTLIFLTSCTSEKDAKISELSKKLEEQKMVVDKISIQSKAISEKDLTKGYELQERCSDSARRFVSANAEMSSGSIIFDYINHYNVKLNKCFILTSIHTTDSISRNLIDINENKELATLIVSKAGKFPNYCKSLGLNCSSEHEWDSLAKPYMEE